MVDFTKVLLNILDTLIDNSITAYNNSNHNYYNHVRIELDKIIFKVKKSEYGGLFEFQHLDYDGYPDRDDLMKAISSLKEVRAFLEAVSGESKKATNEIKQENETLNLKIKSFEEKEKYYLEIIKLSRAKSDYDVDEIKVRNFKGNNFNLINEALNAYSVGAYTACICVCRNILQDLVQVLCKKNSISEGSLKSQIEILVNKKIIKSNHHSSLLELAKFFGHRAAHPTTEVFSKEKANLVLSSLFIINEELFNISEL